MGLGRLEHILVSEETHEAQDRLNRSEIERHGKRIAELEENREKLVVLVLEMIERLESVEKEIAAMKLALQQLLGPAVV